MDTRAGRDIDDPAGLLLAHRRKHQLRQMHRRPDLDFHHQIKSLLGKRLDGDEEGDGGVVHQDVDVAIGLDGFGHQTRPIRFAGKIGLDGHRLAAGVADSRDCGGQRARQFALAVRSRAGRHHDLGTLHGQPDSDSLADAATGTGYQSGLAPQRPVRINGHHCSLPYRVFWLGLKLKAQRVRRKGLRPRSAIPASRARPAS